MMNVYTKPHTFHGREYVLILSLDRIQMQMGT
jgi:hypothetical protein